MMGVFDAGLEGNTVARPQQLFALIGDEYEFARDDDDHFVVHRMPVPLGGLGAGCDLDAIDAELGESVFPRQGPRRAPTAWFVMGRGISCTMACLFRIELCF